MIQTTTKTTTKIIKKHKKGPVQSLQLSPLDLCLKKEIISRDMHKAANFFIYLYKIRYGNKRIISDYGYSLRSRRYIQNAKKEEKYNALYKKLSTLLIKEKSYNILRDTCIFYEFPAFLKNPNFRSNIIKYKKELREYQLFLQGIKTTTKMLSVKLGPKSL